MAISLVNGVTVESIACTLASNKVSVKEYVAGLFPTEKTLKRFIKTTGFSYLRISSDNVTTADLFLKSAEQILADTDPREIGALVFLTQTADYDLPATSHILQDRLGLRNDIICLDINEGCSGYVTGIYVAAMLAKNLNAKVLLGGGDTNSKVTSPDDRATRSIFGDAGFATLISPGKQNLAFEFFSYGNLYEAIIMENSACRIVDNPKNNSMMYMDGKIVMDFTLDEIPVAIESFLRRVNLNLTDISLFACHQPNKLIIETLADDQLNIPHEKMPFVASETGNTSSASIPLVLSECATVENHSFSRVLCVGFGMGMAIGLCLADFSGTKFYEVSEL